MNEPLWIDPPEQLAAGVERWRASGLGRAGGATSGIALDTEFVFERTFRPRLGLIQIAAGGEIALQEIAKLPGFDARRHAQHASRWIEALAAARAAADAGTAPEEPARLPAAERDRRIALEDSISELVARRAAELGISSELLLSRRQRDRALDTWRGRGSLAETIGGFRGRLLGDELDALAARVE